MTESQRVLVAVELLQSIEGPDDDRSDEEWLAEVNRRAERVRRGEANGKPWAAVRDELRAKLR
ncbi:MAG: addiction module protein [Deltaproteobacteria bacterium]